MAGIRTSLPAQPHLYIGDNTGRPLDYGMIYFGEPNKDPEFYPIDIFYDKELTIKAPQPVRTKGGFMNASGGMVEVYAREYTYSVKVLDQYGREVYYIAQLERININQDSEVFTSLPYPSAITRTQRDKNSEQVSVMDFGALGDGSGTTVSHWYTVGSIHYRGYANLSAVQADYPHLTSTDDTIDWAGSQAAVNSGALRVHFPRGTYVLNKSVRTKHTGSYYRNDTGITIYGDGLRTKVTRMDTGVTARLTNRAASTAQQRIDEDKANGDDACFAVHGSNNYIGELLIDNSKVGIYLGQDYSVTEDASVCHNSFDRLQISRCSTGFISACANGNHYNDLTKIHFAHNQIDAHLKNGGRWNSIDNNNRNTFFKIRSARSIVGLFIESGDTNTVYSWHGEGCGVKPLNNFYPPIELGVLPPDCTTAVHLIKGTKNRIYSSQMESSAVHVYNYGAENEFYGNGYKENAGKADVVMKQKPAIFISAYSFVNPFMTMLSNFNPTAFPSTNFGLTITGANLPVYATTKKWVHAPSSLVSGASNTSEVMELGAITMSSTVATPIWATSNIAGAFSGRVKVLASASTTNVVISATADIIAMRNSAGTIIRYNIIQKDSNSAIGEGAGGSEVLVLSLEVSAKNLLLRVQAPQYRDITNTVLQIESVYTKA